MPSYIPEVETSPCVSLEKHSELTNVQYFAGLFICTGSVLEYFNGVKLWMPTSLPADDNCTNKQNSTGLSTAILIYASCNFEAMYFDGKL